MKKILKFFAYLLLFVFIVFVISIERIDRVPFEKTEHFKKWQKQFAEQKFSMSEGDVSVGWSKINITPSVHGPMAGYGSRKGKAFEVIHDSVFVRVLAVENGNRIAYFLSADMLIIPPNVTEKLQSLLKSKSISLKDVHLSATHTHNSLGGWGNSLTGRLFAGSYDPKIEQNLAGKFLKAILNSKSNLKPAKLYYSESVDKEDIRNRLGIDDGWVDSEIRSIIFKRNDGSKANLITYGAHSTVLNSKTMAISRDYPGVVMDSLEKGNKTFGIFMAGAVGSMGPIEKGKDDFDEVNNQAKGVLKHLSFSENREIVGALISEYLEVPMNKPSARLTQNYALRPWAFKYLFGDYPTFVKITKLGNTLILGMPCDFSGELMIELDAYAKSKGIDLIITSFNGSYVGYITSDRLYDRDLYETTTMSWYGYQNGAYFSRIVKDIVDKVSK
ncbi:hypothetical protein EGI26_12100 [Lacihabitans sp. CCS-44]|uniref:neutral/alkaline non-lysosomal ceramidase N-terminal domain-containing protein n=1 Tax=Lacihabitans sp. CCS-44 TaxID=2487331 RepID=UPI0020CD22F6|nr:neutral/alkaline non-lysosomal ceramidase N-terminal domain-containing protein [Lacihabitans sp. CCS-44]MCP9755900.1 hypothetical protein [Lacihabitans sp. CCS-44]